MDIGNHFPIHWLLMAFVSGSHLKRSHIVEFSQISLPSFPLRLPSTPTDFSVDEKQMPRKILGITFCVHLAETGKQSSRWSSQAVLYWWYNSRQQEWGRKAHRTGKQYKLLRIVSQEDTTHFLVTLGIAGEAFRGEKGQGIYLLDTSALLFLVLQRMSQGHEFLHNSRLLNVFPPSSHWNSQFPLPTAWRPLWLWHMWVGANSSRFPWHCSRSCAPSWPSFLGGLRPP